MRINVKVQNKNYKHDILVMYKREKYVVKKAYRSTTAHICFELRHKTNPQRSEIATLDEITLVDEFQLSQLKGVIDQGISEAKKWKLCPKY